jgi:hypothetical protein
VILFVPLAIARKWGLGIWAVTAYSFWLLMIATPPGGLRDWAVCATVAVIATWSTSSRQRTATAYSTVDRNMGLVAEIA